MLPWKACGGVQLPLRALTKTPKTTQPLLASCSMPVGYPRAIRAFCATTASGRNSEVHSIAAMRSCRLPPSRANRPSVSRISLAWPNSATTRRVCSTIRGRFLHMSVMREPSLPAWHQRPSSTNASGQTTNQPHAAGLCSGCVKRGQRFDRLGHSRVAVPSAPEPSYFFSPSFSCLSRCYRRQWQQRERV